MWKKILIAVLVVGVICISLGTKPPSYATIKSSIEEIQETSNAILLDTTTIVVTFYTITDFARGADLFEIQYYTVLSPNPAIGHTEIGFYYRALKYSVTPSPGYEWTEIMREERFVVYSFDGNGSNYLPMPYEEGIKKIDEILKPVNFLLSYDSAEEEDWNFIEKGVNKIVLAINVIWATISSIVIVLVDTVQTGWSILRACLKIVGVM